MPLTLEQIHMVRDTVPILKEHGYAITTHFYADMLSAHKDLNNIFNHTNQINGQQPQALADSLYAYASHIDDLGVLDPAIERISQKHASLYVRADQYDVVGKYLLKAMKDVLGDALTPAVHQAWAAAYKQLANIMIGREEQIYQECDDWTDWRSFVISEKVIESEEITSSSLRPQDGRPLPTFRPGQYVSIRTDVPALHYLQSRQYSLSDAPHADHYRISVKRESGLDLEHPDAVAHPGYISSILHDKKQVGDRLQVSHPAGEFFLDVEHDKRPLVLISAGVGSTPMLSMMKTLDEQEATQPISWIHATRNLKMQAFGEDVRSIAQHRPNMHPHVFMKYPSDKDTEGKDYQFSGRMSLGRLDREGDLFLDKKDAEYFVCGPERFMTDMQKTLREYGVEEERIKVEFFGTGAMSSS